MSHIAIHAVVRPARRRILPPSIVVLLACLLYPASPGADYQAPQYWEPSVSRALISRNDFYKEVELDLFPLQFDFLWDKKGARLLEERVAQTGNENNPWYHLLLGVTRASLDSAGASGHFQKALSLASGSPGMTWVLMMELRRAGQHGLVEDCLEQIESIMLSEGAESVPVIAQQLLAIAREDRKNRTPDRGLAMCAWSARFDRTGAWQALVEATWHLPWRPRQAAGAVLRCFSAISSSWLLQLSVVYHFYRWLRVAIAVFIAVVFAIIAFKATPHLFAAFGGLFPRGVPRNIQQLLCGLVFMSLMLLGLVPFVMISIILFWRYVDSQDHTFLGICMAVTLLASLDNRLTDALATSLIPESPLGLFRQANEQGYSQELEYAIRTRLGSTPDDYLARVALANVLRKVSDYTPMRSHLMAARRLKDEDPVVLVASGNAFYSIGDYGKAAAYYKKCIERHERFPAAYYNLVQCMKRDEQIGLDSALMAKAEAEALGTRRIRKFAELNEKHFGHTVPVIRQVIQPDYAAGYFWLHVLPGVSGLGHDLSTIHKSFIRRLPSILVTAAASGIVLLIALFVKRILRAKTEKKGAEGPMRIVMRDGQYLRQRKKHLIYIPGILDCVFPGSGALLRTSRDVRHATMLMALSSLVHAWYWCFFRFSFSYPFWTIRAVFIALLACGLAYSTGFGLRACILMIKELKR